MGEARRRQDRLQTSGAQCIFCGGQALATTVEHCPPRSLFRDKAWPEGYEFPACESCNGGTSDQDLVAAFMARLDPDLGADQHRMGIGLMKAVNRQLPGFLSEMFERSAVKARADARRLGIVPPKGMTYQELGIANIPEAMHRCVETLAAKLTKAVYFMEQGCIFPSDGDIGFNWFTNAQKQEHGSIAVLEALANVKAAEPVLVRNGKDLRDQFDYRYSVDEHAALHCLQVVFGKVFGFVTLFSPIAQRVRDIDDELATKAGGEKSPWRFLG